MPKRVVKIKLQAKDHRKFRMRTRREVKAYINAAIANGKASRKGTKRTIANIRMKPKYWNKKTSYMVIYFMYKSAVTNQVVLATNVKKKNGIKTVPPLSKALYADVKLPKSVQRATEIDLAFSIRPEEKDPNKLRLQINKGRPLFDRGILDGAKLEPMWNGAGMALVPDYSLDKILLDPKYSKDKVVIPNIPPVPLTEEEKKEWKIFNLESLCLEMPTEEALQYDWEGLRATLEKEGALNEVDFMTYHRETTPKDGVPAYAKAASIQTVMEDERFWKAWNASYGLDVPPVMNIEWEEKDFNIKIGVDIKGMSAQEQKHLLFSLSASKLEDPNWLHRRTDLLLEQGFSQSVIDEYFQGKSLISKEANRALPKA